MARAALYSFFDSPTVSFEPVSSRLARFVLDSPGPCSCRPLLRILSERTFPHDPSRRAPRLPRWPPGRGASVLSADATSQARLQIGSRRCPGCSPGRLARHGDPLLGGPVRHHRHQTDLRLHPCQGGQPPRGPDHRQLARLPRRGPDLSERAPHPDRVVRPDGRDALPAAQGRALAIRCHHGRLHLRGRAHGVTGQPPSRLPHRLLPGA